MTLSSQVAKQVYSGNGLTTVFPIPFPYNDASDVAVYFVDDDLTVTKITTNILIDENTDQITYPVDTLITPAIPSGTKLVVLRETPRTQEVDLENYGFFVPQIIEEAFDKNTRMLLDLAERVSRCVAFPVFMNPTEEDTQEYLQTLTDLKNLVLQYKTDAETAAANADSALDSFDDRYLGAKALDPALDNDGNALLNGAIFFNTDTNKMRVWNGDYWDNIGSISAQVKYPLQNNQALTDVAGFLLNSTIEKSASFLFEIERIGSSEYRQIIQAQAIYISGAWSLTFGNYSGDEIIQDSLVSTESITFSITAAGQFQYSAGNLAGHTDSFLKVSQTRMEA